MSVYDIGPWNNFAAVFGDDILLWPLPIFTSKGDGFSFPHGEGAVVDDNELEVVVYSDSDKEEDENGDKDKDGDINSKGDDLDVNSRRRLTEQQ